MDRDLVRKIFILAENTIMDSWEGGDPHVTCQYLGEGNGIISHRFTVDNFLTLITYSPTEHPEYPLEVTIGKGEHAWHVNRDCASMRAVISTPPVSPMWRLRSMTLRHGQWEIDPADPSLQFFNEPLVYDYYNHLERASAGVCRYIEYRCPDHGWGNQYDHALCHECEGLPF